MSTTDNPRPVPPAMTAPLAQAQISASQDKPKALRDKRDAALDSRDAAQKTRGDLLNARDAEQNLRETRMALVESQEWFHLLVSSVADYAIYMLDPLGNVITWNVGAERSKGYTAGEVLGRNYSLFFLPEDVQSGLPARELARAAHEGGYETEAWRLRKDGTKFWALVTLTPIRDAEGKLRGFAKVTRDMTGHKTAQEALRGRNAELEHYRAILSNVDEYSITTLDAQGRFTNWSAAAERITGHTAQQMLGRHYSVIATEEDRLAGLPQQELEEAARTGRCVRDSWKLRKDGSRLWSSGVMTAFRNQAGELTGFVRIGRDMTAQKQAEDKLRQLNAELDRYRIIVENVADHVIFTLDAGGRIDSWSPGARNVTGYTAEMAVGRDYSFVFTPEEIQEGVPRRELEEAARTGRCASENWRMRLNDSPIWSVGVLTAIRDGAGSVLGFVRVGRDRTAQKRLEESLEKMAADLEIRVAARTRELEATVAELQRKNQEVESFVYIVSHDLRAPLVNVQGFARELDESCKRLRQTILACPGGEQIWPRVQSILDDEIVEALHYISTSATKFERLIDALLGLSRQGRQVYRMNRVNVWELVATALANFQQAIEAAGAEIEIGHLPAATADLTALGQVFGNLIGNCLKYRCPERKLKIEIGGQPEGDLLHYWVRDNGLGIPETGHARLFQVFQRLHPKQAEGEGMGLAIAHRIVERHGGKIWAENNPGQGATFHFSLPAKPESTP